MVFSAFVHLMIGPVQVVLPRLAAENLISGAVDAIVSIAPGTSDSVSFLATVGGAMALFRTVKRKIISTIQARFASVAALGGAIAGAARALMVAVGLVTAVQLSSSTPDQGVAGTSVIGRMVNVFTPDRSTQETEKPIKEPQDE